MVKTIYQRMYRKCLFIIIIYIIISYIYIYIIGATGITPEPLFRSGCPSLLLLHNSTRNTSNKALALCSVLTLEHGHVLSMRVSCTNYCFVVFLPCFICAVSIYLLEDKINYSILFYSISISFEKIFIS